MALRSHSAWCPLLPFIIMQSCWLHWTQMWEIPEAYVNACYASAFRGWRHYVFGLSVRPKPEITSFDLYMSPLVHPTNLDRFSACLSVWGGFRALDRERMEGMVWNFAWWCILGTFRTDKTMVMVCWFCTFWRHSDLVKQVKFGVSAYYTVNALWEWPEILHPDVSWPPLELTSLWLWSYDFWRFLLSEMGQI